MLAGARLAAAPMRHAVVVRRACGFCVPPAARPALPRAPPEQAAHAVDPRAVVTQEEEEAAVAKDIRRHGIGEDDVGEPVYLVEDTGSLLPPLKRAPPIARR